MAERRPPETAAYRTPTDEVNQSTGSASIVINRHAVMELAIYGAQDRVEGLLRETHRTLKRIGVNARRSKPYKNPERGKGAHPNIQDVIRWLNSLEKKHPDLEFLKRLHQTVAVRVPPSFLKSLDK